MAKDVKAKRVTNVIEDDYDGFKSSHEETRFVIVDAETGELLDDARGYGYRTPVSAYRGWSFVKKARENLKNVQKEEEDIQTWLASHPDISAALDDLLTSDTIAVTSKNVFVEWLHVLACNDELPVPEDAFWRYFRKKRNRSI